jgi:glycosyltransferase involved in cell wall biosynthesis
MGSWGEELDITLRRCPTCSAPSTARMGVHDRRCRTARIGEGSSDLIACTVALGRRVRVSCRRGPGNRIRCRRSVAGARLIVHRWTDRAEHRKRPPRLGSRGNAVNVVDGGAGVASKTTHEATRAPEGQFSTSPIRWQRSGYRGSRIRRDSGDRGPTLAMTATNGNLEGAPPPLTMIIHAAGSFGGMERMAKNLIEGLLDRGYGVTLVAYRCDLPAHPNLHWIRIPGPHRPFLPMYLWFQLAVGIVLARLPETVVHTHGAITASRVDVTTVHFCHHGYREVEGPRASRRGPSFKLNAWLSAFVARLAERWSYRPSRARRLVAVSNGIASELRRHFPSVADLVSVIPNGVDVAAFRDAESSRRAVRRRLEISADELVAVFVAGDWARKGLRFAIEAMEMAANWRLIVVGSGDTARFKRFATEVGAGDRVHFVGWDDPAPYYAAADAFVFPTSYEAFPLSVLEAAAAGLPLLVPPVNGVREIVVQGRNGWLIERSAQDIASRLRGLAADPDLRASMGREARAAVKPYDWAHVVEAYDRLYRELSRRVAG